MNSFSCPILSNRASVYFSGLALADALVALCFVILSSFYSTFTSFSEINKFYAPSLTEAGNKTIVYTIWAVSWKHYDTVLAHHPLLLFLEGVTRCTTAFGHYTTTLDVGWRVKLNSDCQTHSVVI